MARILCSLLLLFSVQLLAQSGQLENGSSYEIIQKNPEGRLAKHGEYYRFHASMWTQRDSLMYSTKTNAGEPTTVQADTAASPQTDVTATLAQMRTGEVARITMPLTQFGVTPPGLEEDSVLIYEIELVAIISEADFQAKTKALEASILAAKQIIQAREAEMLAFHADVLTKHQTGELEGIQTTDSGLRYVVHERGTG
ncbi:MAG: hypothetical protein AAF597_14280, partial [Bacteroidota bacterium]